MWKQLSELLPSFSPPPLDPFEPDPEGTGSAGTTTVRIEVTTVGAILDAALSVINDSAINNPKTKTKASPIRTFIGQLKYFDPFSGTSKKIQISDIPVSMKHFSEWWLEKAVKADLREWRFQSFLNAFGREFLSSIVRPICADDESVEQNTGIYLDYYLVQLPFKDKATYFGEELRAKCADKTIIEFQNGRKNPNPLTIPSIDHGSTTDVVNYMFIHSESADHLESIASANTPEVKIGSPTGLVKKVSYSKNDIPFMKEARLTAQTKDGGSLNLPLRELYNIEITMIGNNVLVPGSIVKVDTTALDGGAVIIGNSQKFTKYFNLEGYFRVIKTRSTLSEGKYETVVTAVFESPTTAVPAGASGRASKSITCEVPED
jgi:hypothetical protein